MQTTLKGYGVTLLVFCLGIARVSAVCDTNVITCLPSTADNWHIVDKPFTNVYALLLHGGKLYAGGENRSLCVYDSSGTGTKSALWSTAPFNRVYALAGDSDAVYVGGEFGSSNIVRLVASQIVNLDPDPGRSASASFPVQAIKTAGNYVYVGGHFKQVKHGTTSSQTTTTVNGIAVWNKLTSQWISLGQGVADENTNFVNNIDQLGVRAIEIAADGNVFVGGDFNKVVQSNGDALTVNNIARWDPTAGRWYALGSGVIGGTIPVHALKIHCEELYVGGAFTNVAGLTGTSGGCNSPPPTGHNANRIAKWSLVGEKWIGVAAPWNWTNTPNGGIVRAIDVSPAGQFYFGGLIESCYIVPNDCCLDPRPLQLGVAGPNIFWGLQPAGVSAYALAIDPLNGRLHVGGNFDYPVTKFCHDHDRPAPCQHERPVPGLVDQHLAYLSGLDVLEDQVSIVATDGAASEPQGSTTNPGTFRITRMGPTTSSLTVNFSVSGTATPNSDYTSIGNSATILEGNSYVDITLTPLDDSAYESNETVIVTLSSGSSCPATVTINSLATFLPLPGENLASARALSSTRRSAGLSSIAPYNSHNYHAVYWDTPAHASWRNIQPIAIPVPSAVVSAYVTAAGGQTLAGIGWESTSGPHASDAFFRISTTELLPAVTGQNRRLAYGINDPSQDYAQWVVGQADFGGSSYRACYWSLDTPPGSSVSGPYDLRVPDGESSSWALGINEVLEGGSPTPIIVGHSMGVSGTLPLVWRNGASSLRVLPMLSGYNEGTARDVNNSGVVVGWIWNTQTGLGRAVYWTYDQPSDIWTATWLAAPSSPPANFSSQAMRINESGKIVGYANDSVNGLRAVMWDATGIHFLNDLLPGTGLQFIAAYDVNNLGEIAGEVEEGSLKKGFLVSP